MTAAPPASGPRSRLSGRLQFSLLALLFVAPFLAAWLLYFYFPDQRPSHTTNYGELIVPVRELPQWSWVDAEGKALGSDSLKGKWTLLQLGSGACDRACEDRVLLSRQVRTALAKERDRVQRVLLLDDSAQLAGVASRLAKEHPDLLVRGAADPQVATDFFGNAAPQTLFLIDPLGNYLMLYPERGTLPDFKGIQKDVKKLLKLSQIG